MKLIIMVVLILWDVNMNHMTEPMYDIDKLINKKNSRQ